MSNTELVSLEQLKQAVQIREQIDSLNEQLNEVLGGGGNGVPSPILPTKRKGMSAAGRARVAAAQKLRWSKAQTPAKKGKRVMSAAAKARMAAIAKARWKKAKAAGKTRL
jgi:hypothetical protein